MKQAETQYKPKFPRAHGLLLEVYGNAMKSSDKENVVWCGRFKGLTKGWEILKEDGLLPPLFTDNFWEDVQDVMGQVHGDPNLGTLTEQQELMTFGISNLRNSFGGQ